MMYEFTDIIVYLTGQFTLASLLLYLRRESRDFSPKRWEKISQGKKGWAGMEV